MTNLEKMKNILIEQINGMDATEFEQILGAHSPSSAEQVVG